VTPKDPDPDLAVAETVATSGRGLGTAETVPGDPHTPASTPASARSGAATSPSSSRGTIAVGPGTALGRYQIEDEIGAGGMATVFRARDPQLRRDVAIKVMFPHLAKKPEVARRFQREARAAAGLEHPNILRVYDVGGGRVGELDEPPHIVMELVRGNSLRDVVEDTGPMLAEIVACVGAVLCDALAVAHAAGVIHRDVKPGNVMVSEDGRLLLADFGVARVEDDDSLVTKTGALLGTPSFMSPEQAHGDPLDGRGDVYSVGATLYQLATGALPFAGSTAVVIAAITRGELTPPQRRRPQVGAELSRAITRMMARDRDARPASATDAAKLLQQIATDGGLGEARDELKAYFAAPVGYEAEHRPKIVARAVTRAKAALAERALPRAMGLIDRVLAIEPDHVEAQALAEQVAKAGAGSRVPVIVAGIGLSVLLTGGGIYLATRGEDRVAAIEASLDAALADARAPLRTDGAMADGGVANAAIVDARFPVDAPPTVLSDGRAKARPESKDSSVVLPIDAAPVAVPAIDAAPVIARPIDAAPAPAPGSLTVVMDAWCDLSIDGTSMGRADKKKKYPLDAGKHTIECTQGAGLPSWTTKVTLDPGEHETVKGTLLGDVEVTISLGAGSHVRIAGKTYADGAKVSLKPGRVRVEVLSASTVIESGYVTLPRVAACKLQDYPDLDCYQ